MCVQARKGKRESSRRLGWRRKERNRCGAATLTVDGSEKGGYGKNGPGNSERERERKIDWQIRKVITVSARAAPRHTVIH